MAWRWPRTSASAAALRSGRANWPANRCRSSPSARAGRSRSPEDARGGWSGARMSSVRHGTYSIVARDPSSGELGVAVQSHWFGVGGVVAWARAGVGAVATQSVAEIAHGPNALDRLQDGLAAADAIAAVLREDDLARFRQLGAVDADGRAAAHTGEGCIPYAGEV